MTGAASLERDLLVVACAVSAGVHAALVPGHAADGAVAGGAFAAAAALPALVLLVLVRRPTALAVATAALVLASLLAAYGLAVTTGIPLVHPQPEPPDGLGLFTKAVEASGLAAAVHLLRPRGALT